MPRLRRLSGKEVIKILREFGFEIYNQKGSHVKLERITSNGQRQRLVVAVHGNKPIRIGTLRSIFRQASEFVPEDELYPHFYTES